MEKEYGYIRGSTKEQKTDRQIDAMLSTSLKRENIFEDKQSGKNFERPQYKRLMRRIQPGDTIFVKFIDRLGRNLRDCQYGFRPVDTGYAYTVTYIRDDGKAGEHFVWNIQESVTNFAPVQLTYTVRLMNPRTEAGTYGIYDADGSNENAAALYTNNSAVLYPISSNGEKGPEQIFGKPTVSYQVIVRKPEPEKPAGDVPGTGDVPGMNLWLILMCMGAVGMSIGSFALRKKNR